VLACRYTVLGAHRRSCPTAGNHQPPLVSGVEQVWNPAPGGDDIVPPKVVHTCFIDIVSADPELLALEFEAIVSAHLEPADRPERRRPPQKPTTRTAAPCRRFVHNRVAL
jgi:hypothetical protein